MRNALTSDLGILRKYRVVSNGSRYKERSIELGYFAKSFNLPNTRTIRRLVRRHQFSFGRNNRGFITVRHRGGGVRRLHRLVSRDLREFGRNAGFICRVDYNPCHKGYLSLLMYSFGVLLYTTAPNGVLVGSTTKVLNKITGRGLVNTTSDFYKIVGHRITLSLCKVGIRVFNLEQQPGMGSTFSRAAGCSSAVVLAGKRGFFLMRLSSRAQKLFSVYCQATVGIVSNAKHRYVIQCKAGARRRRGYRPSVRGVAMNPVDHPHGGGNGKHTPGRSQVSIWGWLTKGVPTVRHKRTINADKHIKLLLAKYFTETQDNNI